MSKEAKCNKCGHDTFEVSGEALIIYKNAKVDKDGEILSYDSAEQCKSRGLDHVIYSCAKCNSEAYS